MADHSAAPLFLPSAPPRENPLGLSALALAAAAGLAALGIGGIALGLREREKSGGGLIKLSIVTESLKPTVKEDDEIMRTQPRGFTSFFTNTVQTDVINRLQGYRTQHQVTDCRPVHGKVSDSSGFLDRFKYMDEAAKATDQLLSELYPDGSPWTVSQFESIQSAEEAETSTGLWRWWLWWRVYRLAEWEVCRYKPVT